MNLGDGLLFELENGKPKLILLNRGEKVQKNQVKPRPRLPSVLSCRQPSRLETHTPRTEPQPIRKQNALNGRSHQSKPGRGGATVRGRGQTVTTSKTQENHVPGKEVKTNAKLKAAKPQNVKPNSEPDSKKKADQSVEPSNQSAALQASEACLTNEQLQQILNVVQTINNPPIAEEIQAERVLESSETKEPEETREETGAGNAPSKDKRSGGLLSWVEERPSEDRAALEAKKAQWKKELDEQVAVKQKINRSAPPRLQEDDTESLVSVQSSVSYRDLPAAIRSSLRVGEIAPMDELEQMQEQRQEQRRRWLQELDKQREETSERKRLEKLQQRQTEDQHLWTSHFDSLQRPPLAPLSCSLAPPSCSLAPPSCSLAPPSCSLAPPSCSLAPPSCSLAPPSCSLAPPSCSLAPPSCSLAPPSCSLAPSLCPSADRAETGLGSRLSQWDEASVRASVETSSSGGHGSRASHLRTMTSLLDPTEIEERERRRLKQLEQQRAIELQMEERRRRREKEESRRKREEEEEERRLDQEREQLQRQYERDAQRERNKELSLETEITNCSESEPQSNTAANHVKSPELEAGSPAVNHHRDTAVQTEEVHISESLEPDSCGPVPGSGAVDRAQVLQMLQMLHKGLRADVYEPFSRTDRTRKDEKRPEWNTQRPSRRFVPASQRYPEELQRQRQESRLRRQAQLLSLQRNPNNNTTSNHNTTTGQNLCSLLAPTERDQNRPETHRASGRVETFGQTTDGGRSPVHSESPAPDFLPYVRTDEVFNLKPVEAQPQTQHSQHTAPAPQILQKTQRQQEIIRGLAQLREGLLQKQRELELDLSRGRLDNDLRPVAMTAATYRREL